jgi:hypothetical protein
MDVCVVLYGSIEHKWHEGRKKGFNTVQKWIKGEKTPDRKKNPTGGMDVCLLWVLCDVR